MDAQAAVSQLRALSSALEAPWPICLELADLVTEPWGGLDGTAFAENSETTLPCVERAREALTGAPPDTDDRVGAILRAALSGKSPEQELRQLRQGVKRRLADLRGALSELLRSWGLEWQMAEHVERTLRFVSAKGCRLSNEDARSVQQTLNALGGYLQGLAEPVKTLLADDERWELSYPWPSLPVGRWWDRGEREAWESKSLDVLSELGRRIERAPSKLIGAGAGAELEPPVIPPGKWTELERAILRALYFEARSVPELSKLPLRKRTGEAWSKSAIREALRPGEKLRTEGPVDCERGLGYYRTDAEWG